MKKTLLEYDVQRVNCIPSVIHTKLNFLQKMTSSFYFLLTDNENLGLIPMGLAFILAFYRQDHFHIHFFMTESYLMIGKGCPWFSLLLWWYFVGKAQLRPLHICTQVEHIFFNTALSAAPKIPMCRRMVRLNSKLSRLWQWQLDALTTWRDLIPNRKLK